MTHARTAYVPFDYLAAEVAAAPIAGIALPFGTVHLDPTFGGATGALWRAVEADLLGRFRGFPVDEVVAYRDAVWFPGARDPRSAQDRHTIVPLEKYLYRLARQLLQVDGAALRPRVPRWGYPSPARTGGAGREARAARRTWRWTTFALPWDLLVAALPGRLPQTDEITWLAPEVNRWLNDSGFAEVHCHLGATPDFASVWVWALRASSERTAHADMFRGPGAEDRDGALLAAWVQRSAIARLLTADFLRRRRLRAERLTFRQYLNGEEETGDSLLAHSGEGTVLRTVVKALSSGQAMPEARHATSAAAYRALAGQVGDTFIEPWRTWAPRGTRADPLSSLLPAEVDGLTGSAEMRWVRAGLHYLAGGPDGLETGADPRRRPRDPLFAQVFWQAIRARVALYRHLVQRPLTPGLQWFVRTFARISAARRGVPRKELAAVALQRAGAGRGLRSFEVRIAPEDRLDELRSAVKAVWEGCGGAQEHDEHLAPRAPPSPAGGVRLPRGSNEKNEPPGLECGIVIHFTKRRGGGMDQGRPRAHGASSEAHPRDQYRFGRYYQAQSRQARILATMFRRWPSTLHFVRGLDVCTDEAGIPTWVIAPLYRIVRRAASAAAIEASQRGHALPQLRATAHAGEDFVHLLSGLRRVDEALVHLANREGDRLGHAVALGVAPERWAERTRHVMMTREERLFDLTWEWQFYEEGWAEAAGDRGRRIEEEIRRLAVEIFEPESHLAVREVREILSGLYDPARLFDECCFPGDRWEAASADASTTKKYMLRYLKSPRVFERGNVLIGVDVATESRTLSVLQSALRRRVSGQGVAVEVNPTSNLLIGDMADLSNHPLWRLRPPSTAPEGPAIDVCIGSDDPLTFATTLRDEYQLVLDTLELGEVTTHDAREWLEDARHAGLVYRFTEPTWRRDIFEEGFVIPG